MGLSSKFGLYLDSNAGAPLQPAVAEALRSFFESPASLIPNSSSIHAHGRQAKRWLAEARDRVAFSLGGPRVDPEQVIFTSSGTEANQLAVRSVFQPLFNLGQKPHWITTPVEHDSNRQMVSWLEGQGGQVSFLPVNSRGEPQVDALEGLLRPETALVSVLWVNNETGVITDVKDLILRLRRTIPLHLDAAQAWGKLPINVTELGAQFVTGSGHKIGGLAGSGFLWLARGHAAQSVILGKQEKSRRGGTENLIGAIAMGAAAAKMTESRCQAWQERVAPLRDRLENVISERIPGTWVNGAGAPRVANTLNLNFEGVEGDGLVIALDLAGFSVSSGSACSSGVLEPSHVLMAMGRSRPQAMAAVRISLTDEMPWEELEKFVSALENTVHRVREAAKCLYQ